MRLDPLRFAPALSAAFRRRRVWRAGRRNCESGASFLTSGFRAGGRLTRAVEKALRHSARLSDKALGAELDRRLGLRLKIETLRRT